MRNTSLLIVFTLCSVSGLFAQDADKVKVQEHQIAINATNFIQTLISFNGSTFNNTPYDLQYKFLQWSTDGKEAYGARTGFGYSQGFSNIDQPAQNSKSKTDTEMSDFRFGAEYQYSLTKAWTFFAGIDFLYGKTVQKTYSEFTGFGGTNTQTTDDYRERYGVGPVCGIQFNMGNRLALGTELSLYLQSETRWRTTTFTPTPNNNQFFKNRSGNTQLLVPSFIYFIIRL